MKPFLLTEDQTRWLTQLRPRCAQCNKPVEWISWQRSSLHATRLVFTADCHGRTERTILSMRDLEGSALLDSVFGTVAFKNKPTKALPYEESDTNTEYD